MVIFSSGLLIAQVRYQARYTKFLTAKLELGSTHFYHLGIRLELIFALFGLMLIKMISRLST